MSQMELLIRRIYENPSFLRVRPNLGPDPGELEAGLAEAVAVDLPLLRVDLVEVDGGLRERRRHVPGRRHDDLFFFFSLSSL